MIKLFLALLLSLYLPWAQGFTRVPSCSWDAPGADRYTGSVPKAVDAYRDLSEGTRAKLRQRMERRQYDEVVTIRRDSIEGANEYAPEIRDMHFGGRGRVCSTVSRAKWKPEATERGLVYCEDGACVIVPTVCSNVSRIQRLASPGPLTFDPPAAGGPGAGAGEPDPILTQLPNVPGGGLPEIPGPTPSELLKELPAGPWAFLPQPFYAPLPNVPSVTPSIPEPGTLALVGCGLIVLGMSRRKR